MKQTPVDSSWSHRSHELIQIENSPIRGDVECDSRIGTHPETLGLFDSVVWGMVECPIN